MSYNAILDGYFSSYWLSMGIPVLIIILFYVFRPWLRKGKDATFGEVCLVMGFAFVMIMTAGLANPMWWGYGSPEAVREIRYVDGKLLVIDHIRTMGSETDEGTPCSRVHVLDPATGEKQLRFTLGEEADVIAVHGDTLVVEQWNGAIAYSLSDGSELVSYSDETLPGLFPELSSGIANIMWGSEGSVFSNASHNVMEITANNGKQYALYFDTGKLEPASENWAGHTYAPTNRLYCTEDEVKIDNGQWGNTVLQLDGANGNQYELYLEDAHDSVVNKSLTFLDAVFVSVNNADSTCIILSYETLEHKDFILTCVTLRGEQVWQIHQAQYNSDFEFNDYWKPHTAYNETTNDFMFWIAGDVYCIDARTGELRWQTKL